MKMLKGFLLRAKNEKCNEENVGRNDAKPIVEEAESFYKVVDSTAMISLDIPSTYDNQSKASNTDFVVLREYIVKEPSPLEDKDKELLHEGNEQCIETANVSRTIVNDNISCELGLQSSPTKTAKKPVAKKAAKKPAAKKTAPKKK